MTRNKPGPSLATDHSGYARLGYFGIAIVFAAFGGFTWSAPLDSAAIAPGRVTAETATKPIQHLEGGIVREVLVKESTHVRKGDVLFRLEPIKARAQSEMLKYQATSLRQQLENLNGEIKDVSGLARKRLYPRSKLNAKLRERSRLEGQLGATEIDMARAADVMSRVEIRAPQDGIVQGLNVHAAGAVLKPGDVLAKLVPTGDNLVMAARVSPLDIDNVANGQKAEIRFPAFSSRRIPTILGTVQTVAADSMLDEYTREPYFLARVVVDTSTISQDIHERLVPGMPADVLIITGERTLLEYLVSPISDLLFKSMRET